MKSCSTALTVKKKHDDDLPMNDALTELRQVCQELQ
jgi:hypothetical protein